MQKSHTLPRPSTAVALQIIADYKPGKHGCGLIALGKKYNCEPHTVQDLVQQRSLWARTICGTAPADIMTPEQKNLQQKEGVLAYLRGNPQAQIMSIVKEQRLQLSTVQRLLAGFIALGVVKKITLPKADGTPSKRIGYESVPEADMQALDADDPFVKVNDVLVRRLGPNEWRRGQHSRRMGLDVALFGPYQPPKPAAPPAPVKPRQARK